MTLLELAALAVAVLAIRPFEAAGLAVPLTDVDDHGFVSASVCTKGTFTVRQRPCAWPVPGRPGRVLIGFPPVPRGEHALQAYRDEDGGDRLGRRLFGMPIEAIGTSRDAPLRTGAEHFAGAVIAVSAFVHETTVRLRHVGR